MKRALTTFAILWLGSAALRADVTVVQTTTIEGGLAAMASAAGGPINPKMTTRVKGSRSRTDVEAGPVIVATIVDLTTRQVIILRPDVKTATIVTPPAAPAGAAAQTAITGPTVDGSATPTGKSQVIDGVKCDEFAFTTTVDMSSVGGRQMAPEAVAMMQGMKMAMTGSLWVAKDAPAAAAEYMAFQKSVAASDMAGMATGASGVNVPGMEKLMKTMAAINGLAYLTEATINIEGTGQMAEMMRQMGPMKVTTKISSVNGSALADDLFKVPEGYTITKQ